MRKLAAAALAAFVALSPTIAHATDLTLSVPVRIENMRFVPTHADVECTVAVSGALYHPPRARVSVVGGAYRGTLEMTVPVGTATAADVGDWSCRLIVYGTSVIVMAPDGFARYTAATGQLASGVLYVSGRGAR